MFKRPKGQNLDYDWAMGEAVRCLMCDDSPCWHGCPAGVNPRKFIRKIRFRNFIGAIRELRKNNPLAASCSYICPCLETCAGKCTSEKLDRPINIIGLQRFICDWERSNVKLEPLNVLKGGSRVALIGSGPSGLACAASLALKDHTPVIFDSANEIGGMLRQVIPDFRLPSQVLDFEVGLIKKIGVEFVLNNEISEPEKLFTDGFKAIFLATGLPVSKKSGLIGEEKQGVWQALTFLREVKKSKDLVEGLSGKRILVIGGGDTAIDSARVAARAGAKVSLVYRRRRSDMPAYRPDISNAEAEGVELMFNTIPRSIVGADSVQGARFVRVRWREAGRSANTYDVEGSEFFIPSDIIILAIGQGVKSLFDLRSTPAGYLAVDSSMMTSRRGIFAGGDLVNGPATAVAAVGAGRQAATKIDEYLIKINS